MHCHLSHQQGQLYIWVLNSNFLDVKDDLNIDPDNIEKPLQNTKAIPMHWTEECVIWIK